MLRKFKLNILLRICLLVLFAIGVGLSLVYEYYLTAIFIGLGTAISTYNLIRYVEQTNRDVANFVAGIKYDDYSTQASSNHNSTSFGEMYDVFKLINKKFRDIRAEKEANHQFLQSLVELVDIGLLCYSENGEIILMNRALQKLLHKSYLVNMESLKKLNEDLWEKITELSSGEKELVKIYVQNKPLQLAIQATEFKLRNERYKLISLQNIQSELEERELVAWQKLIRILTHEIMNSVAPIVSLGGTIHDVLEKEKELQAPKVQQVQDAVGVIQKRGEHLLGFTETYRTLTRIPPPQFQVVDGQKLIESVLILLQAESEKRNIQVETHFPPTAHTFQGDPGLLEQVLINLVKNAMDAVEDATQPRVWLSLSKNTDGRILIQVSDNGAGIDEGILDQVFVPFFTTKDEGSGIGLSLSRQIMRLHKGRIEVSSTVGEGTIFTLIL